MAKRLLCDSTILTIPDLLSGHTAKTPIRLLCPFFPLICMCIIRRTREHHGNIPFRSENREQGTPLPHPSSLHHAKSSLFLLQRSFPFIDVDQLITACFPLFLCVWSRVCVSTCVFSRKYRTRDARNTFVAVNGHVARLHRQDAAQHRRHAG